MTLVDSELLDELLGTLDTRARFAVESRFGLVDGERKSFREVGEQPRRHRRSRPPPRQPCRRRPPRRRRAHPRRLTYTWCQAPGVREPQSSRSGRSNPTAPVVFGAGSLSRCPKPARPGRRRPGTTTPSASSPTGPTRPRSSRRSSRSPRMPPLVFAGEARSLQAELAQVAAGNAFLLQAGDCAESFEEFSADNIREKLRVILQMAVVLTYSVGVPIVKVGRIAGQFAKPRSSPTETDRRPRTARRSAATSSTTPTASEAARIPNPERLVQAYHQSASTLNLLRAFTKGGFADLVPGPRLDPGVRRVEPGGPALRERRRRDRTGPRASCGRAASTPSPTPTCHRSTSTPRHEALILGYEEALTRQDSLTGAWFDCSAHMLWIGERTRELDGAHVEFLRGVGNPIGCKIGPTTTAEFVLELCEVLNPSRIPGRLTLITRMGADKVEDRLRPLLRAVTDAGHPGRVGLRSDARQHLHRRRAAARPATSTTSSPRSAGSSEPTAPRAPGRAASTSSSPARTSPSASAAATPCPTPISTIATRRCATRGSTPARASTSPSGSPNSSAPSPDRAGDLGGGPRPHHRLARPPRLRSSPARRRRASRPSATPTGSSGWRRSPSR